MKALITGGAGFIGSNIALTLENQGHEVTVMDSFLTGKENNLRDFEGRIVKADTTQSWNLQERYDCIFHHGDITDPRFEPQDQVFKRNTCSFKNALAFAQKNNAKLVYASTAGLYGNGPCPMKEDQKKIILTEYGRSKLAMDEEALNAGKNYPIVGLRYFNVYGPRESFKGRPASMIYHLYQQMVKGDKPRLFIDGEQKRDFIYVKDCVSANLAALTAPSGVYNVGTGIASSFNTVVSLLNKVLQTNLEISYFEMPFDDKSYQSHTQADTTLASQVLNFDAEWNLEEGIRDYIQWLETK